jgi:hypothetical protein
VSAERAGLTAWQYAVGHAVMFGDDTLEMTAGQAQDLTDRIERAFMSLPVERRMTAMGMRPKEFITDAYADAWVEEIQ